MTGAGALPNLAGPMRGTGVKVHRARRRRHRRDHRLLSARSAGAEVRVLDRQPGPALETSFANAGEVSPGYASPWAAPGIPIKALKWLFMRHRPLFIWPMLDPRCGALGPADARATAPRPATSSTRAGWCGSPSTAATRCATCAPSAGIAYDEREQGTLQLFRTQKQLDGTARPTRMLAKYGVALRGARPRRLHRASSRRWRWCGRSSSAACGCPATRPATASSSPRRWPRRRRGAGVEFRYGTADRAPRADGDAHHRRRHRARARDRRRLCLRARAATRRCLLRPRRHPAAGLSGQGLLDHRCRSPTTPRRRNRRSWTRPTRSRSPGSATASASAAQAELVGYNAKLGRSAADHARARRHRPLPERRRRQPRPSFWCRPAADDAGRHAGDRADALSATSSSTPATARSAGPWPAAPAAWSPTWSRPHAGDRPSTG